MNRKRRFLILVLVLICVASQASAFNGDRKGFVLGIGLGAGYMTVSNTVNMSGHAETNNDAGGLGPSFRLEMGHAPSQQLMITWDTRISWFDDSYRYQSAAGSRVADEQILSVITGPSLIHFSNPASPSFFIGGGPALAFVTDNTDFKIFGPPARYLGGYGIAITAKSGYEFNHHFALCFDLLLGFLSDDGETRDANSTVFSIGVTVNWLGY